MVRSISKLTTWTLYLVALTPLIFLEGLPSAYPLGKMVFFRGILAILAVIVALYAIFSTSREQASDLFFSGVSRLQRAVKNPLVIALLFFLLSMVISVIFAINPYRAFFGDVERQSGLLPFLGYILFLFFSLLLFKEKEWVMFFKISLVVSLILSAYGLLQYLGISQFPFMPSTTDDRPGSFIGNPAFFGTHLIFTIIFSWIVWVGGSAVWKKIAVGTAVFSTVMIFLTLTRGAILGLFAGALFLIIYNALRGEGAIRGIAMKKIAWGILGCALIFGILFFATRENSLWQKIPGLNRLATTDFINPTDYSSRQRILAWRLAYDLFKERPLIGWGVDNFLAGHVMRYNPEMSLYGETWVDKSHSVVMDIMAQQGLLGIFTLLAFFCAFVYGIWNIPREHQKLKAVLIAGLVAYAVQNLFLFDQLVSYIALMSLVGFVVFLSGSKSPEDNDIRETTSPAKKSGVVIVLGVVAVAAVYSLYVHNIVPLRQAYAMAEVKKGDNIQDVIKNLNKGMNPYNFAQYGFRGEITDFFYEAHGNLLYDTSISELSETLVKGQEELIRREPFDVRPHIRIAQIAALKSRNDPAMWEKSEAIMRDALLIAPARPELYHLLAFSLAAQGNIEDGLLFARKAISLTPAFWKPYYYEALVYDMGGERYENETREALSKIEYLNPAYSGMAAVDLNNIIEMYGSWGLKDKAARIVLAKIESGEGAVIESQNREWVLGYFVANENKEGLIALASYMAEKSPEIEEDLKIIIELARQGRWDVIRREFVEN